MELFLRAQQQSAALASRNHLRYAEAHDSDITIRPAMFATLLTSQRPGGIFDEWDSFACADFTYLVLLGPKARAKIDETNRFGGGVKRFFQRFRIKTTGFL